MAHILPEPPAGLPEDYPGGVRLSEFWQRMEARFGAGYAYSVAADYRVTGLAATVNEAIERGDPPKAVWRAVCQEFEVPQRLR